MPAKKKAAKKKKAVRQCVAVPYGKKIKLVYKKGFSKKRKKAPAKKAKKRRR